MLFVGDDWAKAHHDIEIEDDQGRVLAGAGSPKEQRAWLRCTP